LRRPDAESCGTRGPAGMLRDRQSAPTARAASLFFSFGTRRLWPGRRLKNGQDDEVRDWRPALGSIGAECFAAGCGSKCLQHRQPGASQRRGAGSKRWERSPFPRLGDGKAADAGWFKGTDGAHTSYRRWSWLARARAEGEDRARAPEKKRPCPGASRQAGWHDPDGHGRLWRFGFCV